MDKTCNSQVIETKDRSNHYYTNLASLPTSILNWTEQNISNIIVGVNEVGELVYVTKSVKSILGYEPASLLGMNWKTVLSTDEANHIEMIAKGLEEDNESLLIQVLDRNEKNISFECTLKKIKKEDDNDISYLGILKDITNEKEAEEMMVRSEKMSVAGQLAAGIAHEIRNPLTSLKGFLQLLQAGVDQKDAYYKIMTDEIDKIETITSELLFISKPLTDNKQLELVSSMIEDVLVLLQSQAALRSIALKWDDQEKIYVYCDRSQIKQVLINLIKNAIEASDDSTTVKVEVLTTESNVMIDVIDQGVGVSEDMIHKLDEPFFTTKQSGTGLGLMITKNILNYHNADLKIIPNKKRGTTFRVRLPI